MSTVLRSSATAAELNLWFVGFDAMNEAEPGSEHADEENERGLPS